MVLLVGSLAANHVINAPETLALVLGANVGGALPPLLHASTTAARRVPLGNLLVRLTGVLLLLPWLTPLTGLMQRLLPGGERLAVNFHLLFNLALRRHSWRTSIASPPCCCAGCPILLDHSIRAARSTWNARRVDSASVALANAARETLRMSDLAAAMLDGALQLLRTGDLSLAERVMQNDRAARQLGAAIRSYLAAIGGEQTLDDRREGAKVQEILAAVINFEHVGDIIANSLTDFTVKQLRRGQLLAPEEIAAVSAMNAELVESHRLALSVFLRGNRSDALLLLERKRRLLQLEGDATALSVRILREAAAASRAAGTDIGGIGGRRERPAAADRARPAARAFASGQLRLSGGAPAAATIERPSGRQHARGSGAADSGAADSSSDPR
jgi:phosphate:Na+ symporter